MQTVGKETTAIETSMNVPRTTHVNMQVSVKTQTVVIDATALVDGQALTVQTLTNALRENSYASTTALASTRLETIRALVKPVGLERSVKRT